MQMEPTPRSLRERQRKEREDLIVQAAEEVLSERGYHDMSIDEIAARVGIAKGTVYLHFASKEELVFALFEREIDAFVHTLDETAALPLSARARLEVIQGALYKGIGKRIQLLLSLYSTMEVRREVLERKAQMRELMDTISARISALLEEGKAAGEFDPSLPTAVMLSTFFTLLSPHSYKRLVMEGGMPIDELMQHLQRVYFKGITTTPAESN